MYETQWSTTSDSIAIRARQFVDEIAAAEARQFSSIGYGTDHRLKGKALAGTALVHENEVIHAALFRMDDASELERMATYGRRRQRFVE